MKDSSTNFNLVYIEKIDTNKLGFIISLIIS